MSRIVSERPGTPGACSVRKSPAGWKMGKNSVSGLPAAISVSTGTMSVSSLLMAENPVTVPPSRSKLSAKAWAIDRE